MHIPVMVDEVERYILKNRGKVFIDATLGCGGYSKKILESCEDCLVIGFDWDHEAIEYCKKNLKEYILKNRLKIFNESYTNIRNVLKKIGIMTIDGVVFDLGMSTLQLKSGRGFSFTDENFDMRMSKIFQVTTAKEIINTYSYNQLLEIFVNYGEERYSDIAAKAICEYRKNKKIETSKELAEIIEKKLFKYYKGLKIHPATKIFQAIRIFINSELNNIEKGIKEAMSLLSSGGICIVISYHSLEDRIVKNMFKKFDGLKILTKKPLTPSREEILANPSARSAKFRVVEKL